MPTGSEIFSRAAILLNDADQIRWPFPELCEWLNEGVRAIVLAKPSASSLTSVLVLQPGTLQFLPTDPIASKKPLSLIGLNRNILDPAEPRKGGRMIKRTDRAILDAVEPDWHDRTRIQFRREVRNYCYDDLLPLQYYVYPGNDGTGMVEAELGVLPVPLSAGTADPNLLPSYGGDVGLPEPYSVPLLDYVLYRCQLKDNQEGQAGRAQAHYQQFATAIGLKLQVEKAHSPNARP